MTIDNSNASVVVIGGGVVGCSVLYHLAKLGWTDCLLLERKTLTSGSSWHAAGSLFSLTSPSNAAELQKYALELYPQLEQESGQFCGFYKTGELWIARSKEEVKSFERVRAQGLRSGIHAEFVDFAEARDYAPILRNSGIEGILFEEDAGFCDPSSVTHAFARAAKKLGARIATDVAVTQTQLLPNGEWDIETNQGRCRAQYVVNAAGLWGREVAALANISLPLIPVEHQYVVTERIDAIADMDRKMAAISINELNVYMRPEGEGLLLGAYESDCRLWAESGTPLDFGHELLPNATERMDENFLGAMEHIPALETTGIKRVVNGPMIFSPDLGPLIGPYPGLPTYFCANGVMTGFNQGPGIGQVLAQWIVNGDPGMDMSFWDVARYGDYADNEYVKTRAKYFYAHRSDRAYPWQDHPAGRPVRKTPIYDELAARGAVFADYAGWEDPVYFSSKPASGYAYEKVTWAERTASEVQAVQSSAGLFDLTTFAKFEVTGSGAEAWLNKLLAGRIPNANGKMSLTPMLNEAGQLIGDFTVSRLDQDHFWLLSSGSMQHIHQRWFMQHSDEDVSVENLSDSYAGLHIAGPQAFAILSTLAEIEMIPFMGVAQVALGECPRVNVHRVSFTGELGYELYFPLDYQLQIYLALMQAGDPLGLRPVGSHALMSMRLEKGFPSWGLELSADYYPHQCGLSRFIDWNKTSVGIASAALAKSGDTVHERLQLFRVDCGDWEPHGGEPIFNADQLVGYLSSGGKTYRCGHCLALGYLYSDQQDEASLMVQLLDQKFPITRLLRPPYDPEGTIMRAKLS